MRTVRPIVEVSPAASKAVNRTRKAGRQALVIPRTVNLRAINPLNPVTGATRLKVAPSLVRSRRANRAGNLTRVNLATNPVPVSSRDKTRAMGRAKVVNLATSLARKAMPCSQEVMVVCKRDDLNRVAKRAFQAINLQRGVGRVAVKASPLTTRARWRDRRRASLRARGSRPSSA